MLPIRLPRAPSDARVRRGVAAAPRQRYRYPEIADRSVIAGIDPRSCGQNKPSPGSPAHAGSILEGRAGGDCQPRGSVPGRGPVSGGQINACSRRALPRYWG